MTRWPVGHEPPNLPKFSTAKVLCDTLYIISCDQCIHYWVTVQYYFTVQLVLISPSQQLMTHSCYTQKRLKKLKVGSLPSQEWWMKYVSATVLLLFYICMCTRTHEYYCVLSTAIDNIHHNMWPGLQKSTMWAQKLLIFSVFAVS